jgi:hypothetical protein
VPVIAAVTAAGRRERERAVPTVSVVVSAVLSTSAADTPRDRQRRVLVDGRGPATVLTGWSFTAVTVIATVSTSVSEAVRRGDGQRVGAVES